VIAVQVIGNRRRPAIAAGKNSGAPGVGISHYARGLCHPVAINGSRGLSQLFKIGFRKRARTIKGLVWKSHGGNYRVIERVLQYLRLCSHLQAQKQKQAKGKKYDN
jgi:hypothetical protein